MPILPADSEEALDRAARALQSGRLVAFPTETVYGLGGDATNPGALRRIFSVKGRPPDHPLIVHLSGTQELGRYAARLPAAALALAEAFWPGPLTMVVARSALIAPEATGGRQTVGLRVPDHPAALELLRRTGRPVAAPSANRFGRVSPTTAKDVEDDFADAESMIDVILDGGACRVGLESTIVELLTDEPVLLRAGGLAVESIEAVLGRALRPANGPARASGMLRSHYAPDVAIDVIEAEDLLVVASAHHRAGHRIAVLGATGAALDALPFPVLRLGTDDDPVRYARLLYRRFREADEARVDRLVAVVPAPQGVGRAIADRLRKAAAPRP